MVCSQEDVLNYMSMLKAAIGVMERFSIESEVDMKIRQAKKIMRHNTPYWIFRYLCYNRIMLPGAVYKVDFKDHRIIKAISLTNHWNARRYINELIKSNKKHPFKLRDVQRHAERLKQYSV